MQMVGDSLEVIGGEVRKCTLCGLSKGRTNAVPGEGSGRAKIMFIGEAPGRSEDEQGRPFVGAAGKLLTEALSEAGLPREEVFITNVVKCRPPDNRDPLPGEIAACSKYMDRQLELIKPRIVVTLGRYSLAKFFPKETITKARGRPRPYGSFIVFPMFHPAAALRQQGLKSAIEQDMQRLAALIKEPPKPEKESEEQPQQLSMF
jgi:DNA polymerase